jgi:PAS domain S-box-containing protein
MREYEFLAASALRLSSFNTTDELFAFVAEAASQLFPGCITLIGRALPETDEVMVERLVGLDESRLLQVLAMLGADPRGRRYKITAVTRDAFSKTKLSRHPGGLLELTGGVVPAAVVRAIESFLSISSVSTLGLATRDQPFGYLQVFELAGARTASVLLVEAFAYQCSMALSRIASRERLEASERRFRAYFELGLVGMAVTASDMRYTLVNDRLCEILGRPREELLHTTWAAITYPDDLAADVREFERVQSGEIDCYTLDKRFLRGDGGIVHTTIAVRVLRTPDGSVDQYFAFIHDISDRERAEAARLELERRLLQGQKLESIGLLAGGIAHDFNNLLAAVLGNLDLALSDLPIESPARRGIEEAMTASRRAVDLTRQMLAYSGKGKREVRLVDLRALVLENAEFLRASMPKTASLQLPAPGPLPAVKADPGQMQQVVMNLLTNAAEAVGDGDGRIVVSTGVVEYTAADLAASRCDQVPPPGRFAFLEVCDTGSGMDAETEKRIFEPFFSTKFTGRGLGMPAVLGIIRSHGGAVFLRTALREGTTVRVAFPAATEEADGRTRLEREGRPAEGKPFSGTVLLADDEVAVRRMTHRMLDRLGFEVMLAVDGQEAVERFAERPSAFRCVLLDLAMPRLDGGRAFVAIRAIRGDVPVIMSSGYGEEAASQRLEGAAGTVFVQKPYQLHELRRAFEVLLTPDAEPAPRVGNGAGVSSTDR